MLVLLVQRAMSYSEETFALSRHQENKLLPTGMDFWKNAIRNSRKEKNMEQKISKLEN